MLTKSNNQFNSIWYSQWGKSPIDLDKLKDGYYLGTEFGEDAVDFYAEKYLETDNPLWIIPGAAAAAWTPETYLDTAWALASGYGIAKSVPKWAHWEHFRGPHKYSHLQFGKFRIRVPKPVLNFLRKKIKLRDIFHKIRQRFRGRGGV